MRFDLSYEWLEDLSAIRLDAHRCTMANLVLIVGDHTLTQNLPLHPDEGADVVRDFVQVSVYPLAEFVAANWWALLHEPWEKESLVSDQLSFKQRHWINSHTDGFSYPTAGFFGADTTVRVVARPTHIDAADIQFPLPAKRVGSGWDAVERASVEDALMALMRAVTERLPHGEDRAWLADAVRRIESSRADAEEFVYCRCAGLLGADPYLPGPELEHVIDETTSILGLELATELFATAQAQDVLARASWVEREARQLVSQKRGIGGSAIELKAGFATSGCDLPSAKPWDRGYDAARRLRVLLDLNPAHSLQTLDAVSQALLGLDAADLVDVAEIESKYGLRGVACQDSRGLGVAIDQSSGANQQFQLAAIFSDFLLSGGGEIFLSTRASTDRQKCNRAFAAEFLAPIAGIRERLSSDRVVGREQVQQVAKDFGVSAPIVQYQLQNQAPELLEP
ncbi:MAG TPA: hypothetical protein VF285_13055 [Castellaniella sp.]|uniref:ImmA/IrrE family metallo-endopeptidase n=1 Tax=Castellaniella sp. TaxID=1955812 RepID=UPI002EE3A6B5